MSQRRNILGELCKKTEEQQSHLSIHDQNKQSMEEANKFFEQQNYEKAFHLLSTITSNFL